MDISIKDIDAQAYEDLLLIDESHFVDLKGIEVSVSKLTKNISAFANTSGGEIYVGIEETLTENGLERRWRGFSNPEAANAIFQLLEQINPLGNHYLAEFIRHQDVSGIVLHITVFKTQEIIAASDGKVYVRRNAQSLPVESAALERLRYDKGIKSYEDEVLEVDSLVVAGSETVSSFLLDVIPTGEPIEWLTKQFILIKGRPTVAGILLFSDMPQAALPKRSAIKILRYKTTGVAERDVLVGTPETVEGPLYNLIYDAVDKVKQIIEKVERLGPDGMERIRYPEEALHEILTNAVLHRDYNVAADVQVRIFDNRVEIESPGRLPGHITVGNITKNQFARNPKIVRIINKFKNPPNKDVGEGVKTAFDAMGKLRLKEPIITETESTVKVTLRHETLASPEQAVMDFLSKEYEITNSIARDITGIKSENTMKQVFYRLRDKGQIEQSPKGSGKKPSWRKPATEPVAKKVTPPDLVDLMNMPND